LCKSIISIVLLVWVALKCMFYSWPVIRLQTLPFD
jgi:hypothetical protein